MIKRFVPFAHASNIYEIDKSFFEKWNIRLVLSDLDNTLDNFRVLSPSKDTIELKKKFDSWGVEMIILSNNTSSRVFNYAKKLGVVCQANMMKPFPGKIKKYLKNHNISKDNVVLIGDQIMTDIIAGNGVGIKTILTEKLTKTEPIWTRFNRIFERPIKKRIIKNKLLIDWREK